MWKDCGRAVINESPATVNNPTNQSIADPSPLNRLLQNAGGSPTNTLQVTVG
jgi:hypothetical protein